MLKNDEIIILEDMKAYIDFCLAHELPLLECLSNIGHDIHGIIMREECFLPHTAGYHASSPNHP